jgi:hypothetical protein
MQSFNNLKSKDMKKVWIKGYIKPDGTKVKGHYREVSDRLVEPKRQRQVVAKVRLGGDYEKSLQSGIEAAKRHKKYSVTNQKKVYGNALAKALDYVPTWAKIIGEKI